MKKLLNALLLSFYFAISSFAYATTPISPTTTSLHAPVANKDYMVIKNPQPVHSPSGKVEIIEFFWYGCPFCNKFEPLLEAWIKEQGNKIDFKRVPVAFSKKLISHSRLFYTLDELGLAEKLTPLIFNEIHKKKNFLLTQEAQLDFLSRQGIDKKEFIETSNSPNVENKIKRSVEILKKYEINTVPTIIVEGKYKASPSYIKSLTGVVPVLDYLIKNTQNKK